MAALTLAELYPYCVSKAEKKGHSERALLEVITWLTGLSKADIDRHLNAQSTFEDIFAEAELNPNASLITSVIRGLRVEEIENPLTQQILYLNRLVDELAKGKAMEKILRARPPATVQ